MQAVYRRGAELFTRVEAVVRKYKPHAQLGMYEGNLEDLVEEHVTEAAQYEANFKAIKAKRKEVEKLPHFERVGCISMSLAPFKAAVEDQLQRLTDALLLGMRRTALAKEAELAEFVRASLATLDERPQSVEQVGTAKRAWQVCASSA